MAGIDRGDSIRRPADSTLSARTLHRGQEGVLRAQPRVLEQLRQSSPVVAVVVEQKNLGSAQKPLFDLQLSVNNQVLQARSERPFPPGTVLLIEITPDNTLKVLPNPEPGQLNRMMQASLNFWQAHTLPRVHATQLPTLPDAGARQQLAQDYPALRPLLNWLNQSPPLNQATLARWVQEFSSLHSAPRAPGLEPQAGTAYPAKPTQSLPALNTLVQAMQTTRPAIGAGQASTAGTANVGLGSANAGVESLPKSAPQTSRGKIPLPPGISAVLNPVRIDVGTAGNRISLLPVLTPAPASAVGVSAKIELAATTVFTPAVSPSAAPAGAGAAQTSWHPLPSPGNETPSAPVEIRLGQWLGMIEERIHQHPTSLQQSLTLRAQQLLNSAAGDYARQAQASGQGKAPGEELQPLLQLRNWAEAVQGKTQNNAIQQTLSAVTQGDAPLVQQASIPLIWLGLSAWANLEWWQEKERKSDKQEAGGGKRLWRMRLFFELAPLAPVCADLVWEPEKTQLTFWSQDQNTLSFVNRHLDTLEQWTKGLGERELLTRHGMPRKKSTPDPEHFKPLVDVRT